MSRARAANSASRIIGARCCSAEEATTSSRGAIRRGATSGSSAARTAAGLPPRTTTAPSGALDVEVPDHLRPAERYAGGEPGGLHRGQCRDPADERGKEVALRRGIAEARRRERDL